MKIVMPHFASANAYIDPTHRGAFGYFSLDVVTGEHKERWAWIVPAWFLVFELDVLKR